MKTILLVIMLVNFDFEWFQDNNIVEMYSEYDSLGTSVNLTLEQTDEEIKIYYYNKLLINVSNEKLEINIKEFDYNNRQLLDFMYYFLNNYVGYNEWVYITYDFNKDYDTSSFDERLNTIYYGNIYDNSDKYSKIWSPENTLTRDQIIHLLQSL